MEQISVGVIPAAGRGTRISGLPLTRILPKPMLPILNKPILEYVMENMKSIGIEEVFLIVGFKKEPIIEYFGDGKDFDLNIRYIEQQTPQGIAHAISLTKNYISKPFMVVLGDDLTIAKSLNNLVKTFQSRKALVVEGAVYENDIEILKKTCCIIYGNKGRIKEIIEKPIVPKSNMRGVGVYLFDPNVFNFIEATPISNIRNEKEITDTISLIARGGNAYAALLNGTNININTPSDLMKATKLLLKEKNL